MEKNEVYTAVCTGYDEDGAGVVRIDGAVIFVPGLLNGETAKIGITKMKKNYGYGRIVEIEKPSKHRVEPVCSVYKQCGGCQLLHMDREEQNYFKEEKLRMCFRNNAGMDIDALPIITAEPYTQYRNKVQIPVQVENGQVKMGFYRKHTNEIIPFENCMAESALSDDIVKDLRSWMQELRCAKEMRHVLIKHAKVTYQVMVVFIVRNYPFDRSEELVKRLTEKYTNVRSVSCIINRRTDNVILDGKDVLLYGEPWIEEELLGCTFRISARSFFQINPYTTPLLYSKAIEYAGLTGKETLVDLYCGTGTMGLIAAKNAKKVYGIEIVPDAIRDANKNAERNGITNVEFMTADANQGAQRILRSKLKIDAMIIDPPRKGCTSDTLDAIDRISPKRLVYVSCDPATLARDVKILTEKGFVVEQIQPVDMFPGTVHVETVVKLSQHMSTNFVDLDVDMNELYPTSAETKATYADIKKYVLEKFGFKVSNLYISQVKRKSGIIERKSYNHPKSDKNHVPQCPAEKEAAIADALKHFQMI